MIDVKIVSENEIFKNLRVKWNELLQKSSSNSIFLTWEWVYAWWKFYGDNKILFILLLEENGLIIGIVPCCLSRVRYFGIMPLWHLEFLCSSEVCSENLDFILLKGREAELIPIIFNTILNPTSLKYDLINLSSIREDSESLKYIKVFCKESERRLVIYDGRDNLYIELGVSFDDYIGTLSNNSRDNFKRYKRKFFNKFGGSFINNINNEQLEGYFNILIKLYQKRWNIKGGGDSFSSKNSNFINFHKEICRSFYDKGWLSLNFLETNNKVVSALYSFKYNGTLSAYSLGFDPDWSTLSVGTILLLSAIEDCIANGLSKFDFLRGSEEYKLRFAKTSYKTLDIAIWLTRHKFIICRIERIIRKLFGQILSPSLRKMIYGKFFRKD